MPCSPAQALSRHLTDIAFMQALAAAAAGNLGCNGDEDFKSSFTSAGGLDKLKEIVHQLHAPADLRKAASRALADISKGQSPGPGRMLALLLPEKVDPVKVLESCVLDKEMLSHYFSSGSNILCKWHCQCDIAMHIRLQGPTMHSCMLHCDQCMNHSISA